MGLLEPGVTRENNSLQVADASTTIPIPPLRRHPSWIWKHQNLISSLGRQSSKRDTQSCMKDVEPFILLHFPSLSP